MKSVVSCVIYRPFNSVMFQHSAACFRMVSRFAAMHPITQHFSEAVPRQTGADQDIKDADGISAADLCKSHHVTVQEVMHRYRKGLDKCAMCFERDNVSLKKCAR